MARKKETYEAKKTRSKWDISDWTLNNSFMTDSEIKDMINLLKGHMYMKYNTYDEEVIQMTILQGLRSSHLYNPQKASKLVWFQSILRNIFLNHVDPKYNTYIRYHYSLDYMSDDSDDGENRNIHGEAMSKSSGVDDDERHEVIQFTDELVNIINEGDYLILKLRILGDSYADMHKKLGMKTHQMSIIWKEERERLKKEILKRGLTLDILDGRRALNQWSKGAIPTKKPPVFKSNIRNCIYCNKDFTFLVGMGPNTKTCSTECRTKLNLTFQKKYNRKMYPKKKKEGK